MSGARTPKRETEKASALQFIWRHNWPMTSCISTQNEHRIMSNIMFTLLGLFEKLEFGKTAKYSKSSVLNSVNTVPTISTPNAANKQTIKIIDKSKKQTKMRIMKIGLARLRFCLCLHFPVCCKWAILRHIFIEWKVKTIWILQFTHPLLNYNWYVTEA